MPKPTRRKFLGMMAASPLAAKTAGEQAAAQLSGIRLGGVVGYGIAQPAVAGGQEVSKAAWRLAIADADTRKAIKSVLFERERGVSSIDHDLASKKSFSLAAKIAYQRERNVQRELDSMTTEWSYSWLESIGRKFMGL